MKSIKDSKYAFVWYILISLIFVVLQGAIELHMGRNLICPCGIKFWHGDITNYGNSQHLFDWYSLVHTLHGLFFYWIITLLDRKKKLSFWQKLAMAVFIESAWEVVENTKWIITIYRSGYDSFHYTGDSVLNSTGDSISSAIGFIVGAKLRYRWSVPLFVVNFILLVFAIHTVIISNSIIILDRLGHLKFW